MIDIKIVRENLNIVKEGLIKRNNDPSILNELIELDEKRRELIKSSEEIRATRNQNTKLISQLKKENKIDEMKKIIEEGQNISSKIKEIESELNIIEEKYINNLYYIPNIPDENVVVGKDEKDNVVLREWGEKIKFDFEPIPHWEIAEKTGLMDFERGSKLSGSRFTVLRGKIARLERALINFMMDTHAIKNNYTEILPPHMVTRETLTGTGHLPKFEEDLYNTKPDDLFLIPTSEVTLIGMHRDEILRNDELPVKYCGYTPNYRREAGSYGRDVRGYIRQHQFNKVELVWLTHPEESEKAHNQLVEDAEKILRLLELPYRVVELCTGDLGFSARKTYDLEVWLAANDEYKEISSCSNTGDFQTRRANIRFRDKDNKVKLLHALNGSGLAVGRTLVAIMENYQTKEGRIIIPKVLRHYMNNEEII